MNIGEKIAELRRDAGLTQEALASRLVISPQAVSKWERGVANPDLELIPEIARLFGVSTDELLGLSSPKAKETELESRVSSLERLLAMLTEKDDHAMREIQLRDAPRVESFDFTKMTAEEKKKWKPDGLCILDDHQGAALVCKAIPVERAVGAAVDPQLIFAGLSVEIDGPLHVLIHLCTKGSNHARNHHLAVYFTTEENPEWDNQKSAWCGCINGNWIGIDLLINNPLLRGTLTGLRIDPFDYGDGTTTVDSVRLMTDDGELVADLTPLLTDKFAILDNHDPIENITTPHLFLKNVVYTESPAGKLSVVSVPAKITKQVYDPMLINDDLSIDASKARYVHLRMKTSLFDRNRGTYRTTLNINCNAEMKLYFKTEGCDDYTEQRGISVHYLATDQMQDIYIDTSISGAWHGTLTGLRLDPIENQGASFEISQIELLEGTPKVKLSGFMSSLEEKIAGLETAVADLEGELEDARSTAEEALDEVEDLKSELESLRAQMEEKD